MAYVSCARLLPVVCCAAALLLCSFWCGGGLPHETLRCRWDGPFGSCLAAPRSASPLGQSRASGLPHLCTVFCTMLNFCANVLGQTSPSFFPHTIIHRSYPAANNSIYVRFPTPALYPVALPICPKVPPPGSAPLAYTRNAIMARDHSAILSTGTDRACRSSYLLLDPANAVLTFPIPRSVPGGGPILQLDIGLSGVAHANRGIAGGPPRHSQPMGVVCSRMNRW